MPIGAVPGAARQRSEPGRPEESEIRPETFPHRIRRAEPDDATACVAVAEALPDSFTESGVAELRRDLGEDRVTVAEAGGDVVGFVVTRRKSPSVAEIRWLAVARPFQRSGIGSSLLRRAELDAAAAGARLLEVKTLDASAPSAEYEVARGFYEKRGFELLETIDPFPGWEPGNPCAIYVKVVDPR
ncbi:MAG TPA: GNAT family N-acetyltransferase [Actinomycetota bacterium]